MVRQMVRSGRPLWLSTVVLAALAGSGLAQTGKTPAAAPPPAKPAAAAAVGAEPASTSATYGDWVLRCQHVGEGDKAARLCEVAQTVQVQGQQGPIAQIAFGRIAAGDPLRFTAALPSNISLPGSVSIGLSDKDPSPLMLTWRRCLPGACIADGVPGPDVLKSYRTVTDSGRLAFKDAAGRDVAVPVSFRGLAQALDALTKG